MTVKKGFYKHFKGGIYEVIGTSTHSETKEELVIYKDAFGKLWSRPVEMFSEYGNFIPELRAQIQRFTPIQVGVIKTDYGYIAEKNAIACGNGRSLSTAKVFSKIINAKYFDLDRDSFRINSLLNKYKPINAELELTHKKK